MHAREMSASSFVEKVQEAVKSSTVPTRPLSAQVSLSSLPAGLLEATYIYLRKDGNWPLLVQLYEGPYEVVARGEKVLHLQLDHKEVSVSIDRLKQHLGS